MSTYSELLKDPRWERRRIDILLNADFTCEECGLSCWDEELTLQVHHRHYRAGAKPWEYEDADLVCLCRTCHANITDELERVYRAVGKLRIDSLHKVVALVDRLLAAEAPMRLPLGILNYECEEV